MVEKLKANKITKGNKITIVEIWDVDVVKW